MEKLMALYGISSPSGREGKMAKFIIEELKKMEIPFRQDRYGNIYAVKGNRESYPCVVAHMDEVHRRKTGSYAAHLVADSMIVGYDHKRKRMTGIGADDKNGIWICLKCLEDCKMVKCAFFVQEELGCIGSSHADMSFFSDCRFVIQCDRKGNGDMVTQINGMKLCSNEFISAIDFRKYGYKPAQGLNTDVAALKETVWKYPVSIFPVDITNLIRTTNIPSWLIFASVTALSGISSAATREPACIYRKRKKKLSPDIMNCSG